MVQKIDVTEPDFLAIRESIKNFLKGQSEYTDFDFEGGGLAILLDALAYNTGYLAFLANMVGNEMFIDSAVMRESLVSRAKMLGYRPRSRRGAVAYINVEITPNDAPEEITIGRGTKFATTLNGVTYTFSTLGSYVIKPDEDGRYIQENVAITEGEVLRHVFTVNESDPEQRFVLPNPGVDTTTIRVTVQESASNTTSYVYQMGSDLNVIGADSRVFFLQEVEGAKHEIYFGDGVVGVKPVHGNLIIVDYLSCHGSECNGLSSFQPTNGVGGYNSYQISTVQKSQGGASEEGDESIRFLAPLWYQAQGRAVTENDYETLIKMDYPNIDSIRIWGGEKNDPPHYGKVFVCIKPLDGFTLSNQVKDYLAKNVIRKRNLISTEVEVVDPDYVFLVIKSTVKWRSDLTEDSEAETQNTIRDAIVAYGEEELDKFDTYFRYSKFVQKIDNSHEAVQNNLTDVRLRYRLAPSLTSVRNYVVNFSNPIDANKTISGEPTLTSTSFTLDGYTCFFDDDGEGTVRIYRLLEGQKILVRSGIGTIDYATGRVVINQFLPTALAGNLNYVSLTVRPAEFDIRTKLSQLLVIDTAAIEIDMVDEVLDALNK